MSELDRDWIQRDLDDGAMWDEEETPSDLLSELRAVRFSVRDLSEEPLFSR
jgi:hypothetical protein